MQKKILLVVWLILALPCSAQILVHPDPQAKSYIFLAGQPPRAVISLLTPEENAQFKRVYDAALQADPALDAEGDTLSNADNDYRKLLEAAMVKADPKVAPLLGGGNGDPVTDAQNDEIRQAQDNAMQADPTLQSQWDDLSKKMTAHQQAVDAAMLKIDPAVSPILAKFSP